MCVRACARARVCVLQDLVSPAPYLTHMPFYLNIERKNEIPFETTPCIHASCARALIRIELNMR